MDERDRPVPVAIVGMACALPDSPDVRAFWQNVLSGFDPVRDVPPDRWSVEALHDRDRRAPDRTYGKRGAFLSPFRFDPLRYGIPPAVVGGIEPLQLLALDVARQALEDAGLAGREFPRDRTSVVFACSGIHDVGIGYAVRAMLPQFLARAEGVDRATLDRVITSVRETLPPWSEDSFPGFLPNVIAGRIANRLDLRGSSYVVDAACASSLAAVHAAVAELRAGACDVALAGSADWSSNAFTFMSFAKTQALTPGPHARPFDAAADGVVLGEGVVATVLKRLPDAERDGDRVIALIRGVGASSDGRNRSLTAPHGESQVLALRRAYDDAGIDPATVGLVEAHGTGTAVGDATELAALARVVGESGPGGARCAVGSVKSMIGHAKASAGLAGLVKAALAVRDGVLPPTLHVETPNPAIEEDGPLYVNTETRPWIRGDLPRRAGVSAFGFGGTNFHVVLEEHRVEGGDRPRDDLTPRPVEVFLWRRGSRARLCEDLADLRTRLVPQVRLDDLAAAVHAEEGAGESASEVRLAIVAATLEEFRSRLDTALDALGGDRGGGGIRSLDDARGIYLSDDPPVEPSQVAFLYAGQGAQRVGMLGELVQVGPFGTGLFEAADRLLADLLPAPLSRYVFPPPAFTADGRRRRESALEDTRVAQPAVGVLDMFADGVLDRFGLRPAMTAGHSYGEYVALWRAGVYSRDDLLRLSAIRGRAVAETARQGAGGMIAVAADAEATGQAIHEHGLDLAIANLNAPRQTIVGGPAGAVEAGLRLLPASGLAARRVSVSAAFHTRLVQQASDSVRETLRRLEMVPPALPVFSNVTAAPYPGNVDEIRAILNRHLASPVRFVEQVRAMHAAGARVFVEVGPGRILSGLVRRILEGEPHHTLTFDAPGRPAWETLGHLLARAAVLGLDVDLAPWFEGRPCPAVTAQECLDLARRGAEGRPTDWWLEPMGSRRVSDPPRAVAGPASPVPEPESPVAADDTLRRLLAEVVEVQKTQARLSERIVALQERVLVTLSGPAVPELPLAPVPALPPLPVTASASFQATSQPLGPSPRPSARSSSDVSDTGPAPDADDGSDLPTLAEFRRALLDEIIARTGYPEEALEPDLPLEAGLGIDSIKVMEVFSALGPYHHVLAGDDLDQDEVLARFAELRTLQAVLDHYDAQRAKLVAARRGGDGPRFDPPPGDAPPVRVDRLVVRSVPIGPAEAGPTMAGVAFPSDLTLLVLGEVAEITPALMSTLVGAGIRAVQVVPGRAFGARGEHGFEADLTDGASLAELAAALRERGAGPVGGIISLLALGRGTGVGEDVAGAVVDAAEDDAGAPLRLCLALLEVARAFGADLRASVAEGGGIFVNVTGMDGRLGTTGGAQVPPAQAASIGFAKGLAREWPGVRVRVLDLDPAADPRALLAGLAAEAAALDGPLEVGIDAAGRWRIELVEEAPSGGSGEAAALPIDRDGVVLALGGGQGISAEVLKRLAAEVPARFVIVGRTDPDGATERAARLRENRAALEALGATVECHALDVRDDDALAALVEDVYLRHGRIDGVLHGAGVVEDARVGEKTPGSFTRVFDTKVRPALVLARVLRPESLRFLAFFSSVSGRFGNVGQVDYCAANECLNKLAQRLDRAWPARVVALNWGPWDAGMVSARLRSLYDGLGIRLLPVGAGTAAFVEEIRRGGSDDSEVVLACDARRLARLMGGGVATQ